MNNNSNTKSKMEKLGIFCLYKVLILPVKGYSIK